jgi:hypothetical protein
MSVITVGAPDGESNGASGSGAVEYKWLYPELEQCNARLTNDTAKVANFGRRSPLMWELVWAYWKAFLLVQDFGHVNMMANMVDRYHGGVTETETPQYYVNSMVRAFNGHFMFDATVYGDTRVMQLAWYISHEEVEREVNALFPMLPERAKQASKIMSNAGASLVARHINVLAFQYLEHPIEFTTTSSFDLRTAWNAWTNLRKKTISELAKKLPGLDLELVETIAHTFERYGDDVAHQVALPPSM